MALLVFTPRVTGGETYYMQENHTEAFMPMQEDFKSARMNLGYMNTISLPSFRGVPAEAAALGALRASVGSRARGTALRSPPAGGKQASRGISESPRGQLKLLAIVWS